MDGVEFRLGHNDHRVVEDFLSRSPAGVAGIAVDAKSLQVQRPAIDAARAAGIAIHVEPLTDRLVAPGYSTRGLNYGLEVIDPSDGLRTDSARGQLVESVVTPQVGIATAVTPPHFFVDSDDTLNLNLALVQHTHRAFEAPTRPILAVQRTFLDHPGLPELAARRYQHAGVRIIELRISPLGGEEEGAVKIRSVLRILRGFRDAGVDVVLGLQGTIGETALALGLATGFSVGIGYRERYDHKGAITQQRQPPRQGTGPRGALGGVYLSGPAITVSRAVGSKLFSNPDIRTRLICRIGSCGDKVDGPATEPRGHYLHARSTDVETILDRPPRWRSMQQRDRLIRAIDLRDMLNKHLRAGTSLKTRTLQTLVAELEALMANAA